MAVLYLVACEGQSQTQQQLHAQSNAGGLPHRSSSADNILCGHVDSKIAEYSLHGAAEKLEEHIQLLAVLQEDRECLLSQLTAHAEDSLELKHVKQSQKVLEETNERLLRERDSALEQAAQMKGQCDIMRVQYNETRAMVQQLTAELRARSPETEALVLQRICSEVSAKFEIEKANHMATQFELNELQVKYDRVEKELEGLRELKKSLTSNINELTGSLRKSQAESVVANMIRTQSNGFKSSLVGPSDATVSDDSQRIQRQVALLQWQKTQLEGKIEDMECETHHLRNQFQVCNFKFIYS